MCKKNKKPCQETMAVIMDILTDRIIKETDDNKREIYKRRFVDFNSFVYDNGKYSDEQTE